MARRFRLSAAAAVPLILAVFAQGAAAFEGPPAEGKKWAFQFGVSQNLTLTSYDNGEVSLRQCLSPRSALRYGMSVGYVWSGTPSNVERHDLSGSVSVAYLRSVNPGDRARFFWGVGPTLLYEYEYALASRPTSYDERSSWGIGPGIAAIAGAEWFATKVISLHAEYRLQATWLWEKDTMEFMSGGQPAYQRVYKYGAFRLETESVVFGLSVYF